MTELQIQHPPKDANIVFLGNSLNERWRFHPKLWARFGKAANLRRKRRLSLHYIGCVQNVLI